MIQVIDGMKFRLQVLTVSKIMLCFLAASLIAIPGQTRAQPGAGIDRDDFASWLPRVDIVVVQNACDVVALQTKVRSWFDRTTTQLTARQEPRLNDNEVLAPSTVAGVRVWIVARTATTAWLYFVVQREPGGTPRYLARFIALDRGFDELGMEQVAQVVYLSSLALWAGQVQDTRRQFEAQLSHATPAQPTFGHHTGPTPSSPANAAAPAPGAANKDANSPRWRLQSELGYGLRWLGNEGTAQGPLGAMRVLRIRSDTELGARFAVQRILPHQQQGGPVELALHGYSLRATPWLSHRAANGLWVTGEVGPGIDVVRYSVKSVAESSLQPTAARWEVRPMAWLALGIEAGFSRVRLGLQASFAVQLLRTHYDLVDGNQHTALLTPWMIQPGFSAHLVF